MQYTVNKRSILVNNSSNYVTMGTIQMYVHSSNCWYIVKMSLVHKYNSCEKVWHLKHTCT